MASRILVVDAVPTNRIILRVKLSAAYYDVVQATSGQAALAMLRKAQPDLVLTAADLPDMSGRALCAAIRQKSMSGPGPAIPVVVMHDVDEPGERLASLAAGAEDVLTKPIDDVVMLARLRSLLRARDAEAELRLRDDTRRALGLAEHSAEFAMPGRVRVVSPGPQPEVRGLVNRLRARTDDHIELVDAEDAPRDTGHPPDVVVVIESPGIAGLGLSLLPQLRANRTTRQSMLIYIARPHQRKEAASALDLGANDLMTTGPDVDELVIRLKKQITAKRLGDRLRANMRDGLRAAVIDPLTGLYNRRYALPHISRLADQADALRRPYALLLADLDHFKQVNDDFGHAAGDAVLVALSHRLRDSLRAADLIARWGGEEFLIAMPDTDRRKAQRMAERLCAMMAKHPVTLSGNRRITVTLSIGVAIGMPAAHDKPADLVSRADSALYAAKNKGRNAVVMADTLRALPLAATRGPLPPAPKPNPRLPPLDPLAQRDTGTDGATMPPWGLSRP
ncbi:diguanylate cyclase [Sagittula salina]|uniref:diguanylate cyclase n=1 Tax=Sagittula salina TaxID=2820268 RepID=A0A940MU74_9RHOB|nr:diguanylate cyclase [Sagittula salina]MBP0484032.1 diguanylate cyclase [Sagittula salina]